MDEEWASLSLGEKQALLTGQALDRKRELLGLPLASPDDLSMGAHKRASLLATAADATINQSLKAQESVLAASRPSVLPQLVERIKAFQARQAAEALETGEKRTT